MSSLNWGELIKDAAESGSTNYESLPDGDYELKVVESEAKTSQSGKTMFAIKCQVQGGANANRLVWDNLVISPDNATALGIFFRKMSALGLDKEGFFDREPSASQIEQALIGRGFRGQIGSRVYNGQKRNEIKNYYVSSTDSAAPSQAAPAPAAAAPAPAPAPAPAVAASAPSAPF